MRALHADTGSHFSRPLRQRGVSLIELIVFMVVMGVIAVALANTLTVGLLAGSSTAELTQAQQIAQERMELILGQRQRDYFSGFTLANLDPCGPPPAICTPVKTGYSVATIFTANFDGNNADANYSQVQVTVTNSTGQLVQLTSVVAEY